MSSGPGGPWGFGNPGDPGTGSHFSTMPIAHFRQLVMQLVYASLLLIITLRFTCGERKIFSTIKKSQNILNMIVVESHF